MALALNPGPLAPGPCPLEPAWPGMAMSLFLFLRGEREGRGARGLLGWARCG